MPKVSIIVPVYNAEQYLDRCIESILSQTFSDFELILVDDGSYDNCPAICDNYAAQDKRVKVIHKNNGGVSTARNQGIEIAAGDYLMFIDSDDYVDANMLEIMLNSADDFPDYIVTGLCMETYEQGEMVRCDQYKMPLKRYSVRTLFEALNNEYVLICICGPWCKLFKNKIIGENSIRFCEQMTLGEDTYFNLNYLEHCNSIISIDREFYHYVRDNKESLFSKYHSNSLLVHEKVYDKMRSLIFKKECSEICKSDFEEMYFNMLVGCIIQDFKNADKNSSKFRKNNIRKVITNEHIVRNLKHYKFSGIKRKVIHKMVSLGNIHLIYLMFKMYYHSQ
jgi:glycosyltransferase involved in cell wall biosynthesis